MGKILFAVLFLTGCMANQAALREECTQGIGEACNKLGQELEKENKTQAEQFYKRACNLGNTNGCIRFADSIGKSDFEEARRVLKFSCDKGNSSACVKLTELLKAAMHD